MNLLIIGNGFDIAHGLKTNYHDFLQWAYENNEMGRYWGFDLEKYWKSRLNGVQSRTIVIDDGKILSDPIPNPDYVEVTEEPEFVKTLFSKQGDTWIDLENNLAQVIEKSAEKWFKRSAGFTYEGFRAFFNDFLITKFENYIATVINLADVSEYLSVQYADLVLSFNYSNTFERIYKYRYPNVQICYINGKAVFGGPQPRIVFGCDYYSEKHSELSWYNKVFQRAEKASDRRYIDWLKNNDKVGYKIDIVGHSIGKTDHDILRPFVLNENNETSVYYHSPESKYALIHNMIGMVGAEFMNSHRINFLPISELEIKKSWAANYRDMQKKKRKIISRGVTALNRE
jgi:hypothetical protein